MEENSLPPGQTVPPSPAPESLDSAGTNVPVSHLVGATKQYPLETLEVHAEGDSGTAQSSFTPTISSVPFSRRRAIIVSLVITLIIIALTGASAAFLIRREAPEVSSQFDVPEQDVSIGEVAPTPPELEGVDNALLINGNIIARGNLQVVSGDFRSVLQTEQLSGNQTLTLPNASGTVCLDVNNCNFATQAEVAADTAQIDQQATLLAQQAAALADLQTQINQIVVPPAGVTSLNDQAGAITIQGTGIAITSGGGMVGLSVVYGAAANTAVQGNTALICPSGSGNLTGGGDAITLGVGGACSGLLTVDDPTFATSVTTPSLIFTGAGSNGILQIAALGQGTTYTLPDPGVATDTICLFTLGNCAGGGGGGITSINSQAGPAITIANASGAGNTITIDDAEADGASKGIAAFNATNFSAVGGVVNTIQGISTTASPQFAGLTLTGNLNIGANTITGTTAVIDFTNFDVSGAGAVAAVGVNAGSGLLQGTGGLTVGGAVTLSSLTNGFLEVNGSGVVSVGTINLGTDTVGDYVQNLGTLTGLSTTGNTGEGSTPTLSVIYGSSANTSVQGNTGITVSPGTNLTGGGSITLGAGGSVTLNVADSPTFSGDVIVQGGDLTVGTTTQVANVVLHDGDGETITFTLPDVSASYALTLPTAVGSADQCLKAQDGTGTLFWDDCLGGGGGGGITSIDGQTGPSIAINNATGAGNVITIDDAEADGASKGIAAFNATNFTATGGVVNTIQGISTAAAPQFAGLTLTGNLNLGANTLQGTTAIIDFTNFDVDASGNVTAATVSTSGDITSATQVRILESAGATFYGILDVGDLSADQTFTFLQGGTVVTSGNVATFATTGVTAGSGLTGGGTVGALTLDIGAGNGITVNANDIAVIYGSSANTAVQGNTSITVNAGTNLTGGGSITLGAGGSVTVNVADSPTFAGDVVVQGGSVTLGVASAQTGSQIFHNGTNANTVTVQSGTTSASYALTLPTAVGASNQCLKAQNGTGTLFWDDCFGGGGGGVSGSGTANRLAVFTGSTSIGDSSITDDGSTVTINGDVDLAVQGTSITVGVGSTRTGSVTLHNSTNNNTVALQSGTTGASYTLTLPTAVGSTDQCLKAQDGTGTLFWDDCLGGGGGGGITSIDGQTGPSIAINNATGAGNVITIDDATTAAKGIASFNDAFFGVSSGAVSIDDIYLLNSGDTGAGAYVFTGTLDLTGTVLQGANPLVFEGATTNAFETTLVVADPTAARTITLPDASGTVAVSASGNIALSAAGNITFTGTLPVTNGGTGATTFTSNGVLYGNGTGAIQVTAAGTNGQCLVATTGSAPSWGSCAGSGSGVTLQAAYDNGNTITTTDNRDIAFTLANTTTDADFTVTIADDSTSTVSISRADGAGTNNPAQLLILENLDTNQAIANGIVIQSAAGTITDGLDVSDAELTNAVNVGDNIILGTTATIDFTNFDVSGAGAISGVSLSTSGNINTTGGVLQTNSTTRVDNSGNLTNIGNITGTGAITIASSGAGNDVTIDGADQFVVQDAAVFNDDVDMVFTSNVSDTENLSISGTISDTVSVSVWNMSITNNTSSGTQNLALLQNAGGTGVTDALLVLDNADADTAVSAGIVVTSAAGGITTAIDVSHADITNALLFGANDIIGTNFTIAGATGDTTISGSVGIGTAPAVTDLLTIQSSAGLGEIYIQGNNEASIVSDGSLYIGFDENDDCGICEFAIYNNGSTEVFGITGINTRVAGSITTGSASQQGSLVLHDGNGQTATISVGSGLVANTALAIPTTVGTSDTFCLQTLGNCFGSGTGNTLQAAYDAGNTITTTDARDIDVTLANTATDANFLIDIATSSTGRFAVQGNGTDVFGVTSTAVTVDQALTVNAATNLNGNLTITSEASGSRVISGRFNYDTSGTGATTYFQTSEVDDETLLSLVANGTGTNTGIVLYGNGLGGDHGIVEYETGVGLNLLATNELSNDGGSINLITKPGGGGVNTTRLSIDANGVTTFNPTGTDSDFSIQGDTNANLFYVDAGNDRIGIGDATPAYLLTVGSGDLFGVNTSGNVIVSALGAADTATYVCRNSSNQLATCNTTGTGAAFVQGGNNFGGTGTLGLTSSNDLNVITANTTRLTVQADGDLAVDTDTLFVDATGNRVGIGQASPDAKLELAGNMSQAAWGLNGIQLQASSATYTDTGTAGTRTNTVINSFGQPTIASTNAVTSTNAATVYIQNAPAAGTNHTITNAYALWVDDGNARFDGNVGINTSTPAARLQVTGRDNTSGTGTISSSGDTVTGTGTLFTRELTPGTTITASGQTRTVIAIASNTSLTVDNSFSPNLSAASFTYRQPIATFTQPGNPDGANTNLLYVDRADGNPAFGLNYNFAWFGGGNGVTATSWQTLAPSSASVAIGYAGGGNTGFISGNGNGLFLIEPKTNGGNVGINVGTGTIVTRNQTKAVGFNETPPDSDEAIHIRQTIPLATTVGYRIRGASGQTADLIQATTNAGGALLNLTAGGNLGLGDATPDAKLDVETAAPTTDMVAINATSATTTTGVDGLQLTFSQGADAAADTNYGINIAATTTGDNAGDTFGAVNAVLTNTSTAGTQYGMFITNADSTGTTEALLQLLSLDTTANAVTDYLHISTAADDTTTDAIDVSDDGFFNAINVGANNIAGTTAVINFTNFDVLGNGNVTTAGDLSVQGNTTLGDASTDTVTFNAEVASHIIPDVDDTYDLGSTTNRWRDVYVGPASLHIGTNGDEGTLSYNTATNTFQFDQALSTPTFRSDTATFGVASTTDGVLTLQNATNAFTVSISAPNQTTGNATIELPDTAGVDDVFCLMTLNNCGVGSGVTTIGTINSETKSANGAVISGTSLILQTADITFPGLVSTGTQTFAGAKTFNGVVTAASAGTGLSVTNDASIGGALSVTGDGTFTGSVAVNGGNITSTGALTVTPGGTLTLGATGQAAVLRGSTTSITSNGSGNDISLTSADQIMLNTVNGTNIQTSGTTVASFGTAGTLELIQNGFTTTGVSQPLILIDGTINKDNAIESFYAVHLDSTINVTANPTVFGGDVLFRDSSDRIYNTATTLADDGGVVTFQAAPGAQATGGGASTIGSTSGTGIVGYQSDAFLSTAGGSTLTVVNMYGAQLNASSVGAGVTVTNRYGARVGNGAGSGVITNQQGLQVDALTKGTNNIGLSIGETTGTKQINLALGIVPDSTWSNIPSTAYSIYNASTDANYFGGSLGIGDATPDGRLDVELASTSTTAGTEIGISTTVSDTGVVTTGTDTTVGQQINVTRTGATGGTISTTGLGVGLTVDNAGSGTHTAIGLNVSISGTADNNYAALFQGGNVGIGDTTPVATFTVGNGDLFQIAGATGNATTAGNVAVNGGNVTSTASALNITTSHATGSIALRTNSVTRLTVSNSNVTSAVPVLVPDGEDIAPGFGFSADTDTGIWRPGNNLLAIGTAGAERVRFGETYRMEIQSSAGVEIINVGSPLDLDIASHEGTNLRLDEDDDDSGESFNIVTNTGTDTIFSVIESANRGIVFIQGWLRMGAEDYQFTGTQTLEPLASYVEATCNTGGGCTLSFNDATSSEGQTLFLVNNGTNSITVNDVDGQQELSATPFVMGQFDTIMLIYTGDRWVEYSRSDNEP